MNRRLHLGRAFPKPIRHTNLSLATEYLRDLFGIDEKMLTNKLLYEDYNTTFGFYLISYKRLKHFVYKGSKKRRPVILSSDVFW